MGKKLKKGLARHVVDGTISVNQARAMLGKKPLPAPKQTAYRSPHGAAAAVKSAAPALAKAQSARAGLTAEAIREAVFAGFRSARPVTEQDLLDAARPLARPAVTKAAAPVPREDPREVLKALKSWQSPLDAPPGPVRPWTPAELAMLREADKWSDPEAREGIRAGLIARREGNVT